MTEGWGLTGVTVRLGEAAVLDDVTLAVPAGQVTAVVGGDGAGKTTLARVLLGSVLPGAGSVRHPDRRATGSMPATSGVWGDLSVAENVDLVAGAYGLSPAAGRARAAGLLEAAGLASVQDRLGRQLSGGMRQKLGFCLAMLHDPALLVLDEPSTGVDPVSRVELWRMLSRAAADGAAVLLATTYLDEAERAASVLVLDRGTAVYSGDPAAAGSRIRGTVLVGGDPPAGVPTWRRGAVRHALLPAAAGGDGGADEIRAGGVAGAAEVGVAPDLEDAVIALTLERRGIRTASPVAPVVPRIRARDVDRAGDGSAVEAVDVVTTFGGFHAVDGVSLTVRPGQVLGLLGANGAGKTTLIRTVLGLVAPSSGTVRVLGGAPSRATRRRLGYVPQGLGLSADLSVAENLQFVAAAYGLPAVPPLPEDLAEHRDRLVGSLGLGVQRRVAFTAALSHRPDLLVLDEPTSGVDPLARAALWDTVRAQAEAGAAVLVTTHYMQEAEQCDDLVLLAHGRRVAGGSLADVLAGSTAVRVSAGSAQDARGAFTALTAAGLPVTMDGRAVRVAGGEPAAVRAVLHAAGVAARVEQVPGRLEEVMVLAAA
ncbi:MAG TPA: ATP-binding cassette domain-containing protein [Cellulomonas sp.]